MSAAHPNQAPFLATTSDEPGPSRRSPDRVHAPGAATFDPPICPGL